MSNINALVSLLYQQCKGGALLGQIASSLNPLDLWSYHFP